MTQRIDKWLWFVRIFKTRSIATEYIRKGRVSVNGSLVKPAREVQEGDTVTVRKPPVAYTFRIKGLPKSRLGAKLVSDYMENLTPEEELQKLDPNFMAFNVHRDPGTGRPTKKDRRMLDEMIDDWFDWDED
ncbi:MAG: RNA-binding S4 domain-containing protein [Bacteroidales bacterium]|nr:RNA-binding S4 domain-containing protein [Bacteroidales bacterium]HPD94287.1 RNA-binding S4 domain-containing protein [Tenuifilaceae bacterium]HRX30335.1 RNA-binding S4 domain-containing protein [Tenuifilaceae bacterium]